MTTETADIRLNEQVNQLEKQVKDLLAVLDSLAEANSVLVEREKRLTQERSSLLEKNNKARVQVEAMLGRLRNMEHS